MEIHFVEIPMLDKRQVAVLAPYVVCLILGFVSGIAGWAYRMASDHWQTFLYTMVGVMVGCFILVCVWLFAPASKRNNVAGGKSAALVSLVWFLLGLVYAVLLNTILYDEYPTFFSVPYALLITVLQGTIFLQFIALSTCRMPTLLQRIALAWPSSIITSAVLICMILVIFFPIMTWVPYCSPIFIIFLLLAVVGLYQTTYTPVSVHEWDHIKIQAPGSPSSSTVTRTNNLTKTKFSGEGPAQGSLRIVQITDPHIGTMMSVSRLRRICEQAVETHPDLVFLTGDFYTVEAYEHSQHVLQNALEPLKALEGKVFACIGNHDKEHCARSRATEDLEAIGVNFLIGEQAMVDVGVGKVQIVGLDYMRPSTRRTNHINEILTRKCPPQEDVSLRIVLLHDPGAFQLLPDQKSIVFSGHTHGGQFGLVSLGVNLTLIRMAGIPDQGYFQKGSNRLYVHRAHGCRSVLGTMMVRLGCPPEFSLMDIAIK